MAEPYVESLGSWIRDELLAVELLSRVAEAQVLIHDRRQDYNDHRPHSALGTMTPVAVRGPSPRAAARAYSNDAWEGVERRWPAHSGSDPQAASFHV